MDYLQDTHRKALDAYSRALSVADPIRLMFWDRRGLTMPQLRVMFLLLNDDGQTPGKLAERMRVQPGTVTGLTDKLVSQNLLVREGDLEDRRIVRLRVTDEGRRVVKAIEAASVAYIDAVLSKLSAETVAGFTRVLNEFAAAAAAVQLEGEWRP